MSRVPKYKAWDKTEKRMCEVGYIDFAKERAQLAIIVDNTRMAYGTWELPLKDVELLEFTGLHDKNGKEIYEGDIIELSNEQYVIKWGKSGFVLNENVTKMNIFNDLHVLPSLHRHVSEIEVIGNIYENPELLEEA